MLRYAWHLLGRREDAEDATQATFLAVHSALGGGTAVLEPRAWVLRIARNECIGRLRQTERMPAAGTLHGEIDPPASIGVERTAEVRDELRTARRTLRSLPVPEREAFVLREWLGLETGEVALALGLTAGDVEGLAGRARRSLVLAVGGLEPALGCAGTRAALEAGTLNRAARVHLLRCPMCRGVRRALRAPEEATGSHVPIAVVSERLADALPGFASGGGGIVAVLTAKAAAAPLLAKTAALVTAALVTAGVAGQAVRTTHLVHHRVAAAASTSRGGQAHELAVSGTTTRKHAVVLPVVAPRHTAVVFRPQAASRPKARGGVATRSHRHGSSAKRRSAGHHRGASSGRHDGGGGNHRSGGDDHGHGQAAAAVPSQSGDRDDAHGSSDQGHQASSSTKDGSGGGDDSGGRSGEHHGSGHRHGSHSHDGERASGTTPATEAPTTTHGGDNGDGGSDGTSTDGQSASPPVTTTEPTTTEPTTTEPTTTEPTTTEPTTTEPTTTEPTSTTSG